MRLILLLAGLSLSMFSWNQTDSSLIVKGFADLLTQPQKADSIKESLEGLKENISNDDIRLNSTYLFHEAKYNLTIGNFEASKKQCEEGLQLYQGDSLKQGRVMFLNLIASGKAYQRDYTGAIALYEEILTICDHNGEELKAAHTNSNIANLFFSLMDYSKAYTYIKRSSEAMKKYPDDPYYSGILSILSVAESKNGKRIEARAHAMKALEIAENTNNYLSMIVANYALGDVCIEEDKFEEAIPWFNASLKVSEMARQDHYAMLNHIGLLNAYLGIKSFEIAEDHGHEALKKSELIGNQNVLYSLKRKLAQAYLGNDRPVMAYEALLEAHDIYKKTTNTETQESINDILIKYDSEKKERENAQQKLELAEKDVKATRFRLTILILLFVSIILSVVIWFVRYRNKQQLISLKDEKEKEVLKALLNGAEKERERFAIELHDGLASELTATKFMLESNEGFTAQEKEKVLKNLADMHVETRRIAHNLSPLKLESLGLGKGLKQFAMENTSKECEIHVQDFTNGKRLSKELELLVYRITQELVQNGLKHASPNNIDIQLFFEDNEYRWEVEDDGTGMDVRLPFGQGLTSISNRLDKFGGHFNIESSPEGTVVQMSLSID